MLTSENQTAPPNVGAEDYRPAVRRQARPGWMAINFAELWQYRELLFFYAIRDIKVRYKQTLLGAAWAILQPVMTMVVFSIFFGRLGRGTLRRYSLSRFCLLCAAALATVCLCADAVEQQPGAGCAGAHKGVFSTVDHPVRISSRRPSRFCHRFCRADWNDALLRHRPRPGYTDIALVYPAGACGGAGGRSLAFGTERQVPGCPIHHFLSGSILVVCHAGGVFQLSRAGAVADSLRNQPHGWRGRGISLGPVGEISASGSHADRICGSHGYTSHRRAILFPPDGEDLRGHNITFK